MKTIFTTLFLLQLCFSQKILIPMDENQNDHLKAYGAAFWIIGEQINVEWVLTVSYTHLTLPTSDLE